MESYSLEYIVKVIAYSRIEKSIKKIQVFTNIFLSHEKQCFILIAVRVLEKMI